LIVSAGFSEAAIPAAIYTIDVQGKMACGILTFRTISHPRPFVPTDEDRAVVKLLVACGMSQDRVCLRVRGNEGKPISEATLKRHFARELLLAKVEVETIVLTQFMAAINRGERWAICKYMDQRMWA
jgi:hypothetical protein